MELEWPVIMWYKRLTKKMLTQFMIYVGILTSVFLITKSAPLVEKAQIWKYYRIKLNLKA